MTMTPTILPDAFPHLHKAHVALCELDVLRMQHGRTAPPWPRLTMTKLRRIKPCPDGRRIFRNVCGSGVSLTPFMCQALAPRAWEYLNFATMLLFTVSGGEGASRAARHLETAETAIMRARQVLDRRQAEERQRADERWPRLTPEAIHPPWSHMLPKDWRWRVNAAADRFECAAMAQEARLVEDYQDIARRAAPTREAVERAEAALGLAAMHALAAFLD
jgi:hypothetical protein